MESFEGVDVVDDDVCDEKERFEPASTSSTGTGSSGPDDEVACQRAGGAA